MATLAYERLDGLGLAALVRSGEVDPRELIEAVHTRIETLNPRINAVIHVSRDISALAAADINRDAPFCGVPFFMKDLGAVVAGVPMQAGCRYLADHPIPVTADSDLTARFKQAGFVIVGHTNVPEFGLNLTTEPALNGPTRNPWDTDRSAGGSSGGAAAAVAAGLAPIAHATDAAGSIRVPAACCGLVGLKPSRGITPQGPNFNNHLSGLASEHVVTRTVRDCDAVFKAVSNYRSVLPRSADDSAKPAARRIALLNGSGATTAIDPACADAVLRTGRHLETLGHHVQVLDPAVLVASMEAAGLVLKTLLTAHLAWIVDQIPELRNVSAIPDGFEPMTWAFVQAGRQVSANALLNAQRRMLTISYEVEGLFTDFDVLLTPTLAYPPPPLGSFPTGGEDVDTHLARIGSFAPFIALFNISGQPAISVPATRSAQGLPLGVQLVGRLGDDRVLLQLARQLEQAQPWNSWFPVNVEPSA